MDPCIIVPSLVKPVIKNEAPSSNPGYLNKGIIREPLLCPNCGCFDLAIYDIGITAQDIVYTYTKECIECGEPLGLYYCGEWYRYDAGLTSEVVEIGNEGVL